MTLSFEKSLIFVNLGWGGIDLDFLKLSVFLLEWPILAVPLIFKEL